MALSVVLIEPRIPPNMGNVARLCAATGTALHVVGDMGFSLDDHELKRAGLDYWDHVDLWIHPYWRAFREAVSDDRCLYFTAHGNRSHVEASFAENSVLVFGNETEGMPQRIREKHPDRLFRIPMRDGIRNLNLATAVGIVLYEGIRQIGLDLNNVPSEP